MINLKIAILFVNMILNNSDTYYCGGNFECMTDDYAIEYITNISECNATNALEPCENAAYIAYNEQWVEDAWLDMEYGEHGINRKYLEDNLNLPIEYKSGYTYNMTYT